MRRLLKIDNVSAIFYAKYAEIMYIWELPDWPEFTWTHAASDGLLRRVYHEQGRLAGRMEGLGFAPGDQARLRIFGLDVVKTSEIEGESLNPDVVRSSIARRMGIDIGGLKPADRDVEGIVEVIVDATIRYDEPLTIGRILRWHAALFASGRSGLSRINSGKWRTDEKGPMQVVSGSIGHEVAHFEAPPAKLIDLEMSNFLAWFEGEDEVDPVIKAGLAHLWFVTIHPFEDGNGRIGRAILDMGLARSESSAKRFYSVSRQIGLERRNYYRILEQTQRGTMDVSDYVKWYLELLLRALESASDLLGNIIDKARFWERFRTESLNGRQIKILNKMLDDFEGNLTSSKWAKMTKTSQDTASRDIRDLIKRGILKQNEKGGRSTSYSLVDG